MVDNSTGQLVHLGGLERRPEQVTASTLTVDLFEVFPSTPSVAAARRFELVPVYAGSGATRQVLVIDAGTGALALLDEVHKPHRVQLQRLRPNIYSALPRDVGRKRVIAAVPKVRASGATEGAWIFDAATGEVLFLADLDDPARASLHRVDQRSR